ncbi:hypothetical protein DFQ27_007004 [Actinomortierella ambigua]|uniref:Uncharacterized protein n=1 Tax=Actinomortierella ambigua TaxID=1343610 RepID=A0A9P6PXH8_9FUNG|nr:hypothetical protein DFQ27_007004 [Actinomortierella ambigua]
MATIDKKESKLSRKDDRDGFIEYVRVQTCRRLTVDSPDDLEDAPVELMQIIGIECKIEWSGFSDEMKQFWIDRGSVSTIDNAWQKYLTDKGITVPTVVPPTPEELAKLVAQSGKVGQDHAHDHAGHSHDGKACA